MFLVAPTPKSVWDQAALYPMCRGNPAGVGARVFFLFNIFFLNIFRITPGLPNVTIVKTR